MAAKKDSYKNLAFNAIIFAIGSFSSKILVLLLLPIYTSALTKAELGIADLVMQIANFIIPVASLSIADAVIRFGLDKSNDKSEIFSTSCAVMAIGVFIFAIICPIIRLYERISDYVFILFIYVVFACVKLVFCEFARARELVKLYSLNGLLTTVMMLLFNVLFLFVFKLGAKGYLLAVVFSDACSVIFLFAVAGYSKFFSLKRINLSLMKSMLAFCIPLIPTTVLWLVTNVSDRFFVTEMLGEAENGILSVAYKFPTIVTAMYGMFAQAWNMSAITQSDSDDRKRFYTNVFSSNASLVFVCAAGIMTFLVPLINIFTSNEEYLVAYKYAPMLIVSMIFTCFTSFFGGIYSAVKKTKNSMYSAFVGALINVVLNALLIKPFGIQGAVIATLISYVAVFVYRIFDVRRFADFDVDFVSIIVNTAIIFTMGIMIIVSQGLILAAILVVGCALICVINFSAILRILRKLLPASLLKKLHL